MTALLDCPEVMLADRPLAFPASTAAAVGSGVVTVVSELFFAARADHGEFLFRLHASVADESRASRRSGRPRDLRTSSFGFSTPSRARDVEVVEPADALENSSETT